MRVVLAYSGGLDTTAALLWLKEKGYDVYAFIGDIGQEENFNEIIFRAEKVIGREKIFLKDLKEEFVRDYIFPMLRSNPSYEGYLLGTAIARPLLAKTQIDVLKEVGGDAVAHGATGKGNDQVRFELTYSTLMPNIKIIAPWREWKFNGRKELINYIRSRGIEPPSTEEKPYSIDENIFHTSYEGGILEDIEKEPPYILRRVRRIEDTPDKPLYLEIEFENGDPVAVDGERMSPLKVLKTLNFIGGEYGIGVRDIVETRINGLKSRGIYETPGGEIILRARKFLEDITLDGELIRLRDMLSPIYSAMIYKGLWFSPERKALQAFFDEIAKYINGKVRVKLLKGHIFPVERESPNSLYKRERVSFETADDLTSWAEGFIRTLSLRFRSL